MRFHQLKGSCYSGAALAFASFGDAFLYAFLPVNAHHAGLPAMWVGLILSANRFVRIFSNTFVVRAFSVYGLRMTMIFAVILAIGSTFGYAFASGIWIWLCLRVIWGLAFSAMRIGTIAYAISHQQKGLALGLSRSLQEAGPLCALLLVPLLGNLFSEPRAMFLSLTMLSLPALYFGLALPIQYDRISNDAARFRLKWPSPLNTITFFSSITIDGIFVVVLGSLFLQFKEVSAWEATALSALFLGYRRICSVIFSVMGGWFADKFGFASIFSLSLTGVITGLVILSNGWVEAGAILIFTFYSINAMVTSGLASASTERSLKAAAENTTWRDVGAAIGTLAGGLLLAADAAISTISISAAVLTALLFIYNDNGRKFIKGLESFIQKKYASF